MVCRGPRVQLRRPTWGDREAFLEATRASRTLHRPWVTPPTTEVAYRRWLEQLRQGNHERLLAWHREDDAVAGYFGINEIVLGSFRCAYLGYWANADYVGRGYMSEGMDLVLRHVFRTLRLHRVEANVVPENESSKALLRRFGFRFEGISARYLKIGGEWRDHERFALTVEDWRPSRRGRRARGSA